jgi:hypothetical protein
MTIKSIMMILFTLITASAYSCQNPDSKISDQIQTDTDKKVKSEMNETIFWDIMDKICQMGDFIVATGKDGASANIKGKFLVGLDGKEKVIENIHHDHIHLYPDMLSKFNFTYMNVGYGDEPCIEIINKKNEAALRLFYFGDSNKEKFKKLLLDFNDYKHLITGQW